jgi:hypothetical protein
MGQFSVTFPIAAGSVLSDIQHLDVFECHANLLTKNGG